MYLSERCLVFFCYFNVPSPHFELVDDSWKVFLQIEVIVLLKQREVKIFREPVESVYEAQAGSAIESSHIEYSGFGECDENYLLHIFLLFLFKLLCGYRPFDAFDRHIT